MAKQIILALAPTAGTGRDASNPIEPAAIRDEVAACAEQGVALVHIHSRDAEGGLSADIDRFLETCRLVRESCDVIIEASTGGLSALTAEERGRTLRAPEAETASFNMGSLNFGDEVYQNSVPDIRYWLGEMNARRKKPVMELFDTAMVELAESLIDEGKLHAPFLYNFIFDCKWSMAYSAPLLAYLKGRIREGALWGTAFAGYRDFSAQIESVLLGASYTRVGFEDSRMLDGREARSNLEVVRAFKSRLDAIGVECVRPSDARRTFGLPSLR